MIGQLLLISVGAILGAVCRWLFGLWLNPMFATFAFGTLLANLVGCFLIGIAMGFSLSEPHKLLFITGFLGSFTTFSAFSLELSQKLLAEKYLDSAMIFAFHLVGGVFATVLGLWLGRYGITR